MKKLIYSLIILCISAGTSFGQYCGTSNPSGPTQCTATGMQYPGLSPRSDSLPPFINGIASTQVIQFKNFNTVYYAPLNLTFTVSSLRVDSIENLPSGLCWSTDKVNNTYGNQENGCIKINGTPCGAPGQYKMRIKVTVNNALQVDAESAGLRYFCRLANYGDVVPACDTLQTLAFYNVGYSPTANCSPNLCPQFTFTQSTTSNTSCATPNGTITVSATGGTGPYGYLLNGMLSSTGVFTGVSGGTHDVIAVDANLCADTISVTVPATTPVISISTVTNTPHTSCTSNNGALTVAANGGTGPYTYSNGATSNSTGVFTGLASGGYTITATDANSCSGSFAVAVANNVPVVTVAATTTAQTSCTTSNGTVTAVATGGTAPYELILGTDTNNTGAFTGIAAGTHTIKVTDAAGCTANATATVANNIPTITVSTSSTNASGATVDDGTATVTASGSANLSYLWSDADAQTSATATGLTPGTYTVTVSNPDGCSATASVAVGFNVGINSLSSDILSMNIFPNPVSDKVTVNAKFASAKNVTVEIITVTGSKVLSRQAGTTDQLNENFSMKNLAKGNYFVVLIADGKRVSYPITVE